MDINRRDIQHVNRRDIQDTDMSTALPARLPTKLKEPQNTRTIIQKGRTKINQVPSIRETVRLKSSQVLASGRCVMKACPQLEV